MNVSVSPPPCTPDEARELTDRIKETAERLWVLLLEAHERKAWAALGYGTWTDYIQGELKMSRARSYQLLDQGRVIRAIEEASGVHDRGQVVNEWNARDLKPVLPELTEEIRTAVRDVEPEEVPDVLQDVVDRKLTEVREESDGVRSSLERAEEEGWTRKEAAVIAYVTLKGWNELGEQDRASWLIMPTDRTAMFNSQKTANIEWARWSWNPVSGCLHNCPYCYARDIANRFYAMKFAPAFYPARLAAPKNTHVPPQAGHDLGYRNVFTCSMADLFGKWVPRAWIEAVLEQVRANPQWNFLFLTKFPVRLSEFDFPDNAWVGTTVDCQVRVRNAERSFARVHSGKKWLSLEPLLEPLQFESLEMFDWVVLGGASASSKTPEWRPPMKWVRRLWDQADEAGLPVYDKTNLLSRRREYPGVQELVPTLPKSLAYLPSLDQLEH